MISRVMLRKVQDARMNVPKAGGRRSPRREKVYSDTSASVREAVLERGSIRLDTAVASSCGRSHAVNEDCHSALDGTMPVFVVADGVSSGAMASCASRELVSRIHATLEHGRARLPGLVRPTPNPPARGNSTTMHGKRSHPAV